MANFTVNNELQTLYEPNSFLTPEIPDGLITDQCDIKILESTETKTFVDVGIIIVLVFFVLLFSVFCISFLFYKLRKRNKKLKSSSNEGITDNLSSGVNNLGLEYSPQNRSGVAATAAAAHSRGPSSDDTAMMNSVILNNQKEQQQQQQYDRPLYQQLQQQQQQPHHLPHRSPLPHSFDDDLHLYRDPGSAEHYDLENASSIAPSDIDVVYHYKGFRDGGGGVGGH